MRGYRIVKANTLELLEILVRKQIKKKWRLHGSVVVDTQISSNTDAGGDLASVYTSEHQYLQVMVK